MTTKQAIESLKSPENDQEYIYFAEYYDGTILYEYDNDHNHLNFNSIEQDKVHYFGFIGNGMKVYWDLQTGLFYIGKQWYKIVISAIEDENNFIPVSVESQKKDLITFKEAHTDCLINGGYLPEDQRGNIIDGYFIGFKTKMEDVFIQILFSIPVTGADRRPFFGVRISSKNDKTYRAELTGTTDSNKFSRKDIKLRDGKSSAVELRFN